jgi:hypothetical protein
MWPFEYRARLMRLREFFFRRRRLPIRTSLTSDRAV